LKPTAKNGLRTLLPKRFFSLRVQLVASVFLWISPALVLTFILNQDWFWNYAPDWLRQFAAKLPWESFGVGFLALVAAWYGGEHFILRQVRALMRAVMRIAQGDLQARSGLVGAEGEIGLLAQKFDEMASALQQRQKERDEAEARTEKLAAFVKENPNAALELSTEGSVTYFNDAAERLAKTLGQADPAKILPESVARIVTDCLADGCSRNGVHTKIKGRTISWSFQPLPAGRMVHCHGEDITTRLNLEAQLLQSEKMKTFGQFSAGIAHDFNNMLTIIQGHTSKLLTDSSLSEDTRESLEQVYSAGERAARLTRQLLLTSRKNVMQPRLLDMREVVGNTSKMLESLVGETIELRFQSSAAVPFVLADQSMIEQVVMNLASNARDAMPKGGVLKIDISEVFVPPAHIDIHPDAAPGHYVMLEIADNGCGMDDGTRARIFEPFFTTKDIGKGTGLGLATVFNIARQHNGWVEVKSQPGQGSTFSFYLPASGEESANHSRITHPTAPKIAGGNETILIVEDEEMLRRLARDILNDCGYRTLEAATGLQALEIWNGHQGRIDLLLTDMVMPEGVSGVELAEQLVTGQPQLKVVFMSGYTAEEINASLLERNHASFIQKPYGHADLAKIVRDCLDRNAGRPALQ
jgi:signal transduction histidine kinase/ActR/RegA family two-component response regulator/HAMP domain-containing protein